MVGGKMEIESDNSGLILHHPLVSSGKGTSQHAQCSACYDEDQTFQQVSVVVLTAQVCRVFV